MAASFEFFFPIWRPLDRKIVRGQIRVLKDEIKKSNALFDIVTAKFSPKSQPTWVTKVGVRGADLVGTLSTTTPPLPYLAEGTSRRFAVLDRRYSKKTTAGKVTTGSGSGGRVLARGKRKITAAYARRKRIKPGNWHHIIAKSRVKIWQGDAQRQLAADVAVPHSRVKRVLVRL